MKVLTRHGRAPVAVIAITEESYSGGEALAITLARRLRFHYVTAAILLEHANLLAADRDRLRSELEHPPGLLRRLLLGDSRRRVGLLRKALLEEIEGRNVVCYGAIVDLLPKAPESLTILVHAPFASRTRLLQNVKKLDSHTAIKYLHESDICQRRWCAYVGSPRLDASAYQFDLSLNVDDTELEESWALIERRISERLVTEPLSRCLPTQKFVSDHPIAEAAVSTARPVHVGYSLAGLGVLALLSFLMVQTRPNWGVRANNSPENIAGIVTDTFCAGQHHIAEESAECVRRCVLHPGTKYALFSGTETYVMSDQSAGEKFAGQNVIVRGTVDRSTGMLEVASIQSR